MPYDFSKISKKFSKRGARKALGQKEPFDREGKKRSARALAFERAYKKKEEKRKK